MANRTNDRYAQAYSRGWELKPKFLQSAFLPLVYISIELVTMETVEDMFEKIPLLPLMWEFAKQHAKEESNVDES